MRLSLSYWWTLRPSNSPDMTFVYYACRLSLKRPSFIVVANDNETALCTLLFWCSWQSLATWLPLSFSQLRSLESTAYIKSATIRWQWPAVSLNGWICERGSRSRGLKNLAAMFLWVGWEWGRANSRKEIVDLWLKWRLSRHWNILLLFLVFMQLYCNVHCKEIFV